MAQAAWFPGGGDRATKRIRWGRWSMCCRFIIRCGSIEEICMLDI